MPIDPAKLPSWSEFLFVAKRQGVHIGERRLKYGREGHPEPPVLYLQRENEPKIIAPPLLLGDIVQDQLLASLCRRLRIDPVALGITLDDLQQ